MVRGIYFLAAGQNKLVTCRLHATADRPALQILQTILGFLFLNRLRLCLAGRLPYFYLIAAPSLFDTIVAAIFFFGIKYRERQKYATPMKACSMVLETSGHHSVRVSRRRLVELSVISTIHAARRRQAGICLGKQWR